MAETERRRRRPAVSCVLCRRRKIRCNREAPCSNCIRSRNETCVYDNHPPLARPESIGHGQVGQWGPTPVSLSAKTASNTDRESVAQSKSSKLLSSGPTSAVVEEKEPLDVDSIKSRIRELEEQLPKASPKDTQSPASVATSNIETTTSFLGGTFHVHRETLQTDQVHSFSRSVSHKTRLFGQSHWINRIGLFRDIIMATEPYLQGQPETSKVMSGILRSKSLARLIKARRSPPWPTEPSRELPTKDVADDLVDCYLRTIETVYRILHIPTFRRNYEAIWLSDTTPDMGFLIQLKLVLAIGAATYDDNFSLRISAARWMYEAQTWLSEPKLKARLGVQSLQTDLLLLFAREATGIGEDTVWIAVGSLFRTAIHMGLHRDPQHLPKRTAFISEMRRRLWNTILEISLQSSLNSGGPPLVSLGDYDTEPPGNYDDDQLVAENPIRKPDSSFTQISVAIALRRTFPIRLAVTKFLNDLGSHSTYEETLRLDAELRKMHKALTRTLQNCRLSDGHSASQFGLRAVNFIMNRYIISLHKPFFEPTIDERTYSFSRKVVVETSLKQWCAAFPSSSILATQRGSGTISLDEEDFARLTTSGSGFWRVGALEANLLVVEELKAQVEEEDSLGPAPLRSDLLSVLEDHKAWSLRSMRAGETSMKGYLLGCILEAYLHALIRRLPSNGIGTLLIQAAEHAEDVCLPLLEEMAAQCGTDGTVHAVDQMSLTPLPETTENWDFLMSDIMFNQDSTDPMTWMFGGETSNDSTPW